MELGSNWLTEPVFDFEYKKYQLLGYLQSKKAELQASKIYPHLNELESHQSALDYFLHTKKQMDESFRKEIIGIDVEKQRLKFASKKNDSTVQEIMEIVLFSYEKITDIHHQFTTEANEIKKKIHIQLSGLLPSYLQEGFLLIRQKSGIFVFNYQALPILNTKGEKKFQYDYLGKHSPSITVQEESIKKDLIKTFRNRYSHPVFFEVSTSPDFPIYETILPIAEQELNRWVK